MVKAQKGKKAIKSVEKSDKKKAKGTEIASEDLKAIKKRNPKAERALKKFEPKNDEDAKMALIIRGHSSSQIVNDVLMDLNMMTRPFSVYFTRKNEVLPFDDSNSLEFLMQKNHCSIFALGNHIKKRPNNLIFGRTFDGQLLDMVEFHVIDHKPIQSFQGSAKQLGSKPIIVFQGDAWGSDPIYTKIENLFLDVFRGAKATRLSLKGIDHVIAITAHDDKIYIRGYLNTFMKSGTKVPDVKLNPMGPFLDLSLRRHKLCAAEMWAMATKKPKNISQPKKVKNISRNELGEKMGRIHMEKQNLDTMKSRRVTALRNGGRKTR
jgi:ribosome production factor 2